MNYYYLILAQNILLLWRIKMSKIIIPRVVDGQPVYNSDSKHGVDLALSELQNEKKLVALFMNELLAARSIAGVDHEIWTNWYFTTTAKATGMAKKDPVVLYIQKPNPLSNPKNIADKIDNKLIKNGAVIGFDKQFQKFLQEYDNETIYLVRHEDIVAWPNGLYGIDAPTKEHMQNHKGKINGVDMIAINHPQAKPFGVTEEYLVQHKKIVGPNIGMYNSNDLIDGQVAWRLLAADFSYDLGSLIGGDDLSSDGRFFGVQSDAVGGAKKIRSPLESLAGMGKAIPDSKLIVVDGSKISQATYDLLSGTYKK
ncbi:TPA: hypothetical protein HA235_06900 [Candidatus Woesearchaeota archaeon]|nr:hypothetical protein [Candidatus Woesearchaeota archaeon]HIJ14340.1 hypothetical protein [Candidatus Woesearchaeota archaeon]